jgi:hypothetical protein
MEEQLLSDEVHTVYLPGRLEQLLTEMYFVLLQYLIMMTIVCLFLSNHFLLIAM